MGPCIGTEKRETYWACGIISFRVPPSTSQQSDKGQVDTEAWVGERGKGPPVAAPSSFPPPLNHVFFFYRHHLDQEAGLALSWMAAMFTKV